MKPITGLIRIRAKAGMTIPAAPRMTSASREPEVLKSPCVILPLCRHCGAIVSRDGGGDATDLLIVGGGPAGMMAGLLFARAGVQTLVLEKHADFLRDFRGDTVHPSTMEILDELGLLERFLERPHDQARRMPDPRSPGRMYDRRSLAICTRRRRSSR